MTTVVRGDRLPPVAIHENTATARVAAATITTWNGASR